MINEQQAVLSLVRNYALGDGFCTGNKLLMWKLWFPDSAPGPRCRLHFVEKSFSQGNLENVWKQLFKWQSSDP